MTVLTDYIAFREQTKESATLRLLRAANAPVILAILDSHFDELTRKIPVPEFLTLVETDLEDLNVRLEVAMDRSAQAYCDEWRKAGYLARSHDNQRRLETYEPTTEAQAALAFIKRLAQPGKAATQSRLTTIIDQVNALARTVDPDEQRRRESLMAQRDAIDDQIRALDNGDVEVYDDDLALESAREIITLAQEIPLDFGRVKRDFRQLSTLIYQTIVDGGDGYEDILDDIFSGIDRISQSSSGRSFRAFYDLLRDIDRSETLQDNIDEILDQEFARELTLEQRLFLRNLIEILQDQSDEVNTERTTFARSLRRYVQNNNFLQDRIIKRAIDKALGTAHRIVKSDLAKDFHFELALTSTPIRSVGQLTLYDPLSSHAASLSLEAPETLEVVSYAMLQAMARETDIDFSELVANVNDVLAQAQWRVADHEDFDGPSPVTVSVGDVLHAHPATQGVASVVGLMTLALDHGVVTDDYEVVSWQTRSDEDRRARIQRLKFYKEVSL